MEYDSQLFQDLIKFLSNLGVVRLPTELELARETLLYRIRAALPSADTYINMQLGKTNKDHTEDNISNDYVPPSTPSFLYRYQPASDINKQKSLLGPKPWSQSVPTKDPPKQSTQPKDSGVKNISTVQNETVKKQDNEEPLLGIYWNMSRMQAETKAHKFGPLNRIEKGLFYDSTPSLWAALVGSHLLLYKMSRRPMLVISIRGCTCEPVVVVARGKKKADPTFELCCSDQKTYQFICNYQTEMQEWIEAIRRCDTTAEAKNVDDLTKLPKPAKRSTAEEPILEEFIPNVEYEDIVNPDVPNRPVNSKHLFPGNSGTENVGEYPRLLPKSRSPNLQESGRMNLAVHKAAENIPSGKNQPLVTAQINRGLPSPPTAQKSYHPPPQTEDEELIYNSIDEPQDIDVAENLDLVISVDSDEMNLYDDIENLKPAIELLKSKENQRKLEKTAPTVTVIDEEEMYDDIGSATKEAKVIDTKEHRLLETPKNKKEKKPVEEPGKVSARISPLTYMTKWWKKNESPQKGDIKKIQTAGPPKPQDTATTSSKCLPQSETSHVDQVSLDQSDYNSPPPPRLVSDRNHPLQSLQDDQEEQFYDDINNRMIRSDNDESAKQTKGKVSPFPPEKKCGPLSSEKTLPAKNKLQTSTDSEIYQNQSGDANELEDNLEHYQIPRGDANAQTKAESEDSDNNRLYDDVEIVKQKKRFNEKAKQKPAVSPPKTVRRPLFASLERSSIDKIHKFSKTSLEKSCPGITIPHKFNMEKKRKPANLLTFQSNQLESNDNEMYDDCIAVRSLNAKNQ
ncbi:uncharacterized protein LOC105686540 isoform X1 [Athalia rosae]|uniref:uncharacterized protein LOC105686540 isoform X1 n=2 Tax=Athalia rosae TaxID=37344 RepID=UPI0020347E6F|nr:uncharacterized protein LOC105686540 isoform X1 [Athalia rosae]XP_048515250.1 uncharacterized protein LOC105686540 isoform X1 [Athalia rosae]